MSLKGSERWGRDDFPGSFPFVQSNTCLLSSHGTELSTVIGTNLSCRVFIGQGALGWAQWKSLTASLALVMFDTGSQVSSSLG
jgi:hypothetical protein